MDTKVFTLVTYMPRLVCTCRLSVDIKVFPLVTSQLSGHVGYLWTVKVFTLITSQLSWA